MMVLCCSSSNESGSVEGRKPFRSNTEAGAVAHPSALLETSTFRMPF